MAKKKAKPKTSLITWEEVNKALRRRGELDIAVSHIEGDMTLKINEVRAEAEAKAAGFKAERKKLDADITGYCESHKEKFAKDRTKKMTYGLVGYRVVKRIAIRNIIACVTALKALKLTDYLHVVEKPDKEAMEELDDNTLAKVGASRKVDDKLRIEPNLEKIGEVG